MKICFPVRKHDGGQYSTLEEVMGLIGREPHGSWLAGTNQHWHGGIHISQTSAPGSVLTADRAKPAVPLQCMATGEVVAWRLNQDYKTASYIGKELRYSSSFVLVKSLCQPAPEKEESWLEFYSLYMGLAPLSAFSKTTCFKAKTDDILKRAVDDIESSASSDGISEVPTKIGALNKGERVAIQELRKFRNNGVTQPFGLAKMLNASGEATGEPFWVTLLPDYMEEDGEQYAQLPAWMQKAISQGTFDKVVKPSEKSVIEAGDAIGFLGEDIAPAGKGNTNASHYAHIEVISADSRVSAFLNNPTGITTGQRYIRLHPGADLYIRADEDEQSIFIKTTGKIQKDSGKILRVTDCSPFEDEQRKTWYKISNHSWMSQDDVDLLGQYDLKELGFTTLEEEASPDVTKSLRENWMKGAYHWLSEQVGKERGIQQRLVSTFYQHLIKKIDSDGDGELSGRELYNALHHPELGLRDIAARLIVKHDSEWFGGSSHHRWNVYFQRYDRLRVAYAKQWLDDHEWMSQVDAFKSGEPVWHFHPVMFLGALNNFNSNEMDLKWLTVPKGQLTFDAEGNDVDTSIYFSRHPHVPNNRGVVIGASGITYGRGLDLGQISTAELNKLAKTISDNCAPLSSSMLQWLKGAVGLQRQTAYDYAVAINDVVPENEQTLTRKQQYYLFNDIYLKLEGIAKKTIENPKGIRTRANPSGVDLDPERIVSWGTLPQNIKDILVDLTFRGDNRPSTREFFIPDLVESIKNNDAFSAFKGNVKNNKWKDTFNVPLDRHQRRCNYL